VKKIQVVIALVLVAAVVSASSTGTTSFAALTETHGAISIAFDDNAQDQYDYAFPLLQAKGMVATFYVVTDDINDPYMSVAELQALQDYGCEIGSHSKTHPPFTALSDSEIREECEISKQVLQSYGLSVNNFAYPYGDRNNHTDSIVAEYYRSARSAYAPPYIMQFPVSQFVLPGFPGETGDPDALSRLQSMADEVYSTDSWAIIFFHHVIPDVSGSPYAISSQEFESFLDYIAYKGVPTITVNQGLDLVSPPVPPPSVTISPTLVRMYVGQSQTFSSSITDGNPPLSFQWVLNGDAVLGATSPTWTFIPATTGIFNIYLNVTDALNNQAQSNVAQANVYSPLSVTISPADVDMIFGTSQQFTSVVTGGALPHSYQWFRNDTLVPDAISATWTFTPAATGTYKIYLLVDDGVGTARSNNATVRTASPLAAVVSPTHVSLYFGESLTFSASVSGGFAPYSYQWVLNDAAVPGATGSEWRFTPRASGNYDVYINVTDSLNNEAQSNVVSDVNVYCVNLLLNAEPSHATHGKGHQVTFGITVFNQLNPALDSTLTIAITGPDGYHFSDFQPISVTANAIEKYSFTWTAPNTAGTYTVEASLAPSLLTAYDAMWLKVA
jgi:peptidoglycan/xylan/chitin deacetylase (PgdA/CDA1 family)